VAGEANARVGDDRWWNIDVGCPARGGHREGPQENAVVAASEPVSAAHVPDPAEVGEEPPPVASASALPDKVVGYWDVYLGQDALAPSETPPNSGKEVTIDTGAGSKTDLD